MGLDVYLHHCPDRQAARTLEGSFQAQAELLWSQAGGYDKLTEEQRKEIMTRCRSLALSLGLNDDGESPLDKEVQINSARHPEHYFKVGYFRSSYNESGLNRVLNRRGLSTLDDMFEPGKNYEFTPDWEAAKARTEATLEALRVKLAGPEGKYRVQPVNMYPHQRGASDEKEAMEIWLNQLSRENKPDWRAYSNGQGDFWLDGQKVFAVINAKAKKRPFDPDLYLVVETSQEYEQWVTQALEIVIETCDYVLSSPQRDQFYLYWSA